MVVKAESVDDNSFDTEVMSSDVPVLVDFYAVWCGPCKLIAPLVDWAASEFEGKLRVVKLDTEENPKVMRRYKIAGLPTLVIIKDGETVASHEGAIGKGPLAEFITSNLPGLVA